MQTTSDRLQAIPTVILRSVFECLALQEQMPCLRLSKKWSESIQKILDQSSWTQKQLQKEWWVTPSPGSLKKAGIQVRAHLQGTLRFKKFGEKTSPIEKVVAAGNRILALGETFGWLLDHNAQKITDLSPLPYPNRYLENYCITADATHLLVRGLHGLKVVELQTGQIKRQISSLQGRPFSIGSNRLLLVQDTPEEVSLDIYDWPLKEEVVKAHSIVLRSVKKPSLAFPLGTDRVVLGTDYRALIWGLQEKVVSSFATVDLLHAMYPWPDVRQVVISDATFCRSSAKISLLDVETGCFLRRLAHAQYEGVMDMLTLPDGRLSTYTYNSQEVQLHDHRFPGPVGKLKFSWTGITAAVGFGPYFWTSYDASPKSSQSKGGYVICWDMRKNQPVREQRFISACQIEGTLQGGNVVGRVKNSAVVLRPCSMTASFEKGSALPSCKRRLFT